MTESASCTPSQLGSILDLLSSAGYGDANRDELSLRDRLVAGLAWCISAVNSADHTHKIDTSEDIEAALRLMGCPHGFQATQIDDCDYAGIYPTVQWIVDLAKTQESGSSRKIEEKGAYLTKLQLLKESINDSGITTAVQELSSLLKMSKALERKFSEFEYESNLKHSRLVSEISVMEDKFSNDSNDADAFIYLDHSLDDSSKKLRSAKTVLARKLHDWISLKRQLDEVPTEAELLQYDRRFSELDDYMQDRLRITRRYYDTYNAVLEIKDVMLKETSLLNSIDSQFRDAISNPPGRAKLIDSVETIVKGTQQKLERVRIDLQVEQKSLDSLREKYLVAVANRHDCSLLLKALKEESIRNEQLKEKLGIEKQRGV